MPNNHRLSLFAGALALAAVLPAHRARADQFNWANSTYTYNAATPTAVTPAGTSSQGGNALSVQFSTGSYFADNNTHATTGVTIPANPAVGTYNATNGTGTSTLYTDGGTPGFKALQILADFDNSAGTLIANASITVTVFFSKPVSNLIFSFYDVDNGTVGGAPYNDLITGVLGTSVSGTQVRPVGMANGASNTYTLNATTSTFTATGNNNQYNPGGNGTVNFGNTPITQFSFTYSDTAAAGTAHSTLQIIALGEMQFNTVPEPSTWACFAAAGGLGVWTLRRRSRRQV